MKFRNTKNLVKNRSQRDERISPSPLGWPVVLVGEVVAVLHSASSSPLGTLQHRLLRHLQDHGLATHFVSVLKMIGNILTRNDLSV